MNTVSLSLWYQCTAPPLLNLFPLEQKIFAAKFAAQIKE
jgi:hypothetical protein